MIRWKLKWYKFGSEKLLFFIAFWVCFIYFFNKLFFRTVLHVAITKTECLIKHNLLNSHSISLVFFFFFKLEIILLLSLSDVWFLMELFYVQSKYFNSLCIYSIPTMLVFWLLFVCFATHRRQFCFCDGIRFSISLELLFWVYFLECQVIIDFWTFARAFWRHKAIIVNFHCNYPVVSLFCLEENLRWHNCPL